MPDLGNLLSSSSLALSHCPNLRSATTESCDSRPSLCINSVKALAGDELWWHNWGQSTSFTIACDGDVCGADGFEVLRRRRAAVNRCKKASGGRNLEHHVRVWTEKKVESGVAASHCVLPFIVHAPRLVECLLCHTFVYHGEEVYCTVRDCQGVYHLTCAKERLGFSTSRKFKCPQHVCFICKRRLYWRCVRCTIASHDKCAPWPDKVIYLRNQSRHAVCWRHPTDWRLEKKVARMINALQHEVPASDIKEVFSQLPLPYVEEEFKIDFTWKDGTENRLEPPPYVHIKRNVYLVKKKRDDADDGIGCTSCSSTCSDDCVCRVQSISCSKACRCSEMCTNRPFRKDKKIMIVKTELCGWGVEAAEFINKGDFVIEYIGEVIDDALCEQRLWDMKYKGLQNFYMCEIRKDFTIDATFKGNSSRFLNHSCDPNCKLEKWQVDGETRVGVFAARSIKPGEPLTYDYRFVQFGPEVRCYCGAPNCQGYLGSRRKIAKIALSWGSKRKRSSTACLALITV